MLYVDKIFESANSSSFERQRWEKNLAVRSLILVEKVSSLRLSLSSIYLYFFKYSEGRHLRKNCKYNYIFNSKLFFFLENSYLIRGLYSAVASRAFNLIKYDMYSFIKSYKYNIFI